GGGAIHHPAVFTLHGKLDAANLPSSPTRRSSDLNFSNDGELLVTANSTLLLLNDTLSDFVSSQGGKIQVDGAANGTGTGSTLELQNTTTTDLHALTHPAVFTIHDKIEADNGTSST